MYTQNIVLDNLMTKKQFRDMNVVSKCLQIFQQQKVTIGATAMVTTKKRKKQWKRDSNNNECAVDDNGEDVVWNTRNGDEELTEIALDFFDGCRYKNLLSFTSSTNNYDCENFLPLCAITLHEFGSTNYIILNAAIELLEAVIESKTLPLRKIEHSGVRECRGCGIIQILSSIRTSSSATVDENERLRLRKLIRTIMG